MKQMRASLFKARCLRIMDDIQATGEPVVITKHGVPVVKVVPILSEDSGLFGFMSDEVKVIGDIEAPLVPLKQWEVMKK